MAIQDRETQRDEILHTRQEVKQKPQESQQKKRPTKPVVTGNEKNSSGSDNSSS